ncbi:MAG: ABC transporter ATP-binding protein [Candidatus Paceibacterota bacterium]
MVLIECQNISKIYKNDSVVTVALKDISFKIEKGEFVAIIGPSGSGKSTLMNILGCLDTPSSGKYLLEGIDVSKLSDNELAKIRNEKIGFVFQSFNLLPRVNVLNNVILPLIYSKIPFSKRISLAKEALKKAAFPEEFYYHFPNQLSGGMQQRVAIARALVTNPEIILADEPTGNLDSKTGDEVLLTFKNLNEKGHTIVIITHEKYIAEKAKRIIALKDGEIVEDTFLNHRLSQEVLKIKE